MRYIAFLLIILSSIGFFNYHGIVTPALQKGGYLLCVLFGLFVAMRDGISLRKIDYPRVPFVCLLIFILFSAVMATALHPQSLTSSLICTIPFAAGFFTFYIFLKLNLPAEKVMNTLIVLCVISAFVYFSNVVTMPNNMFGAPILYEDVSRGIIRLPVVFIFMQVLLVFYGINKWFDERKPKWILLIGFCSFIIFLSVVRQVIAYTAVLSLFFFFRKVSFMKKLMVIVAALCVVIFVLPQIPVYKTMIELSEDQRDENETDENIRITAWRYYTYGNQTNDITPLLGNGVPALGQSKWGIMMDSETEDNGCYAADVGWAGFFWYFGLFALLSVLIWLVKALRKHKPESKQYLSYFIVFILLANIASGSILYYWEITQIMIVMYLIYKAPDNDTDPQAQPKISLKKDDDGTDNTKLQQFKRYPQLH